MEKLNKLAESIFWTTLAISFILLLRNGLEPLFILAFCPIPALIFFFYVEKFRAKMTSLLICPLVFGGLGRYNRYFIEIYTYFILTASSRIPRASVREEEAQSDGTVGQGCGETKPVGGSRTSWYAKYQETPILSARGGFIFLIPLIGLAAMND